MGTRAFQSAALLFQGSALIIWVVQSERRRCEPGEGADVGKRQAHIPQTEQGASVVSGGSNRSQIQGKGFDLYHLGQRGYHPVMHDSKM